MVRGKEEGEYWSASERSGEKKRERDSATVEKRDRERMDKTDMRRDTLNIPEIGKKKPHSHTSLFVCLSSSEMETQSEREI